MAPKKTPGPWDVVSTAPITDAPSTGDQGGWNVVSTAPIAPAAPAPAQPQQGFFSSAADASGLSGLASMAKNIVLHPYDSAKNVVQALNPANIGNDAADNNPLLRAGSSMVDNTLQNGKESVQAFKRGEMAGGMQRAAAAIPVAGQIIDKASDQAADNGVGAPGNSYAQNLGKTVTSPGAMGTLFGGAAGVVAPKVFAEGMAKVPGAVRRTMFGDVTAPMTPGGISPLEQYQAAQRLGVQPDMADATNYGPYKQIKKVNEHSFLGSGTYDQAKTSNIGALQKASDSFATGASPLDPEAGGTQVKEALQAPFRELQSRTGDLLNQFSPQSGADAGQTVQSLLKEDHATLKDNARAGFATLADKTQGAPLPGHQDLGKMAGAILDQEKPYYDRFPTLRPAKTMAAIGDVSRLADTDPTADPSDYAKTPADWSTMHRLGGDLHSLYMDNPDLTKTKAQSLLQGLVGKNGEIIRDAGAALSPELRPIFDQANSDWGAHKGTYDNSSSPFYQAIRTPNPSTLTTGVGSQTPEAVAAMRVHMGPQGVGIVQRGVGENLAGSLPNGNYDLSNLAGRLNKLPEDYSSALFGPSKAALSDIGSDYAYHRPYAKAAFETPASEVVKGIGPKTAQNVNKLRGVVGDDAMGPIQRGTYEQALRSTNDGSPNFKTFGTQWNKIPKEYRASLFSPEQQGTANDIANTGVMLSKDANPAGTGKLNQANLEFNGLFSAAPLAALTGHPGIAAAIAAEPLLHYPVAKMMNSPSLVKFAMKPAGSGLLPYTPKIVPLPMFQKKK